MESKIHYLEILHTSKLILLKNAKSLELQLIWANFRNKKKVNIQTYRSFKETQQNLKKI